MLDAFRKTIRENCDSVCFTAKTKLAGVAPAIIFNITELKYCVRKQPNCIERSQNLGRVTKKDGKSPNNFAGYGALLGGPVTVGEDI